LTLFLFEKLILEKYMAYRSFVALTPIIDHVKPNTKLGKS
jgi:hypothetical protein